jgi:general secretion pathway protein D
MKQVLRMLGILCLSINSLYGQTIAEKKAGVVSSSGGELSPEMKKVLVDVNRELAATQEELNVLYKRVQLLYQRGAPLEEFEAPIDRIQRLREQLNSIESRWRVTAAGADSDATYALWYQPETTIGQLINDYGSQEYVYVTTPEIAKMKLSVDSNLPIPRSSWDEMLQLILNQSGIGVRQLSPFLRELFLLQKDSSAPELITDRREELDIYPGDARVVFVLTPEPAEGKRVWFFLNRFVNPASMVLQMIGRDILLIGRVSEVQDILKVYDFVATHRGDREYKVITVRNVDVEEMAKILGSIFDIISEAPKNVESTAPEPRAQPVRPGRNEPTPPPQKPSSSSSNKTSFEVYGSSSLKIIPLKNLAQAIFLVGTKEEIAKAEEIVQQVEGQLGESRLKVVFSYRVRHSEPDELAQILQKVYTLMIQNSATIEEMELNLPASLEPLPPEQLYEERAPEIQRGIYDQGYYLTDRFIVNPDRKKPRKGPANQGRDNFIVDPKTGMMIMVVEVDLLPKIKELIRKLDVPKKMVQVEVMLVEQVIDRNNSIGLNLLQIGTAASQLNATSLVFNAVNAFGITDFIISRAPQSGIPAYDAVYRFLLSRDDIRINASPSILILNETEGTIEIEQEISVETGIFVIPNAGTQTLNSSFARARYGIKIDIIPTIHGRDEEDDDVCYDDDVPDYITLDSDIKFETIDQVVGSLNSPSTPDVTRRVLQNEARIADGQTVIIGGLRRKNSAEIVNSIPFLGELPGFGKLFSTTSLVDQSTEMFIFMTPKIVTEPSEDLERIKMEEMSRRPGDIPGFMCALEAAKRREKERAMTGTMIMLFGLPPSRCVDREACEYNGRD